MDIEPVKSTRIYEEIVRQVKQLIADGQAQVRRPAAAGARTSPRSSW